MTSDWGRRIVVFSVEVFAILYFYNKMPIKIYIYIAIYKKYMINSIKKFPEYISELVHRILYRDNQWSC